MRLSAFLEAWVQLVGRRELDRAQGGVRYRIPRRGVTELIKHHKVAAASSQPWRGGASRAKSRRREAGNASGIAKPVSGTGARAPLGACWPNISRGIPP